jgi:hypothetical protein
MACSLGEMVDDSRGLCSVRIQKGHVFMKWDRGNTKFTFPERAQAF